MDTLEIALREQIDLVNRVFLVESTKTHKGVKNLNSLLSKSFLKFIQHMKPLVWEQQKNSQRFAFVGNYKVEHKVLNPEETVDSISDNFQIQDKEVEAGEQSLEILFLCCSKQVFRSVSNQALVCGVRSTGA